MTLIETRTIAAAVLSAVLCALSAPAAAGPITLETQLVFDGPATSDTALTPRLGEDRLGEYVVFDLRAVTPFGLAASGIFLQRLDSSGAPDGALTLASQETGGETMPDASGQWVVYTKDLGGEGERIMLHDLITGSDFLVDDVASNPGLSVSDAHVDGDMIVWTRHSATGDIVMAQRISLIGTRTPPTTVRGPVPATSNPEVDSRIIVWEERLAGSDSRIGALEIGGSFFSVGEIGDGFDEVDPATWGDLIAFGLIDQSTGLGDIVLRDIMADTTQTFSLGLEGLSALSLSSSFLTFNALDVGGVKQAFLLRLADGVLLQLTSGPEGGGVADIFGDLVAYTSGQQLFVARIGEGVSEVPLPPALAVFGLGLAGLAGMRRLARGAAGPNRRR